MSWPPPLASLGVFGCGGHLKTWGSLSRLNGEMLAKPSVWSPWLQHAVILSTQETARKGSPGNSPNTPTPDRPLPTSSPSISLSLCLQETDRCIAGTTLKSRWFSKARESPACTYGSGTRSQETRWGGRLRKWGIQEVSDVPQTLSAGSCSSGRPAPFTFLLVNQCPYFALEEQLPPEFSPWNSSSVDSNAPISMGGVNYLMGLLYGGLSGVGVRCPLKDKEAAKYLKGIKGA